MLLALAAAAAAPICADRPAKATGVCTVAPGHFQIEIGTIDWSRFEDDGVIVKSTTGGSSLIKLGLTDRSDLELTVTPYVRITTAGASATGAGDVVVRFKQRLTADKAPVQLAVEPFVKLPTASHDIGNRKLEGGLIIPIGFTLAGPVSATLGPEVDVLEDLDGRGRHADLVNVLNLSVAIGGSWSVSGELWGSLDLDPARTIKQASADLAAAYLVSNDVQLDAGANAGLTGDTPDIEIYAGISARF